MVVEVLLPPEASSSPFPSFKVLALDTVAWSRRTSAWVEHERMEAVVTLLQYKTSDPPESCTSPFGNEPLDTPTAGNSERVSADVSTQVSTREEQASGGAFFRRTGATEGDVRNAVGGGLGVGAAGGDSEGDLCARERAKKGCGVSASARIQKRNSFVVVQTKSLAHRTAEQLTHSCR